MTLVSFASEVYSEMDREGSTKWSDDFRRLMRTIQPTSHEITMVLSLCSAAIDNAHPLPPFMPRPKPFELTSRLEELDHDILSIRHVNEPGYAAFAVLQLCARSIGVDVDRLLDAVRELVGELDFTLKITNLPSGDSDSDALPENEKAKSD